MPALLDMVKKIRYCETLKFDEGVYPDKIQILRVGEWSHMYYGDFEITNDDLVLFKENFDKKVRRIDLALDAEHYSEKGAAAWFKELVIEGGGLYAMVEWTEWGREIIDKKLFKYISPEFDFEYKDEETGQKYSNVLFGAALTNRPFIKDMEPVLFSENVDHKQFAMFDNKKKTKTGGKKTMELKDVLKALGLSETATLEDVKAKVAEMQKGTEQFSEIIKSLELDESATHEDVTKKFSEVKKVGEGKVMLSEDEVKKMKADSEAGQKALEKLKLNERNAAVKDAIDSGKILPKQKEWADKYALNDMEGFKAFVESAPVVVKLNEDGTQHDDTVVGDGKEAREKLDERAKVLMSEKSISYVEAVKLARKESK